MATIKAYTDLEQSHKLAEILPLESADMYYDRYGTPSFIDKYVTHKSIKNDKYQHLIPCWSLAALLDVLPKRIKDSNILRIDIGEKDFALWYNEVGCGANDYLPDITADNPIDACVAMIENLHELKIL